MAKDAGNESAADDPMPGAVADDDDGVVRTEDDERKAQLLHLVLAGVLSPDVLPGDVLEALEDGRCKWWWEMSTDKPWPFEEQCRKVLERLNSPEPDAHGADQDIIAVSTTHVGGWPTNWQIIKRPAGGEPGQS